MSTPADLEQLIAQWRAHVANRATIATDADELEGHLRDQIETLTDAGLSPDEAFIIAVKRIGRLDDLSSEFAREHSERLWKQLVMSAEPRGRTRLLTALGFAVAAGLAVKIPQLLVTAPSAGDLSVAGRNPIAFIDGVVIVLALLGAYFAVRTRPPTHLLIVAGVGFVGAAAALNGFPFAPGGVTWMLAAIHAPVALWIVAGVLFVGSRWRSGRARMDFIRFTGEWFVYFTLIALGGGVLILLTMGLFTAIGVDVVPFVEDWMLPSGAAGAVIVSAWLVEAKQAVVENIAPVLTRVFTPLFTVLLLALIVAGLIQGDLVGADRDLLILFDLTLIVVLGLLLYSMSARDPLAPVGWFDRLQLVLLTSALVVDLLVLIGMLGRIGAFGASPNKIASLGLNLILLVNLAGAAWLQGRFLTRRSPFATLERWQTSYLPVYLGWAGVVVIAFPPVFRYA